MTETLTSYGPALPVPELVAARNRLYHEHEAAIYERSHPEIFEQLPPLWREMTDILRDHLRGERLRILDLGCGTGFEALQCLAAVGAERVERLVCYDPSPEMLRQRQRAVTEYGIETKFLTDQARLSAHFNVLLANSVLLHMVRPVDGIRDLVPLLSPKAVWLCGHEPSLRPLRNPACRAALQGFRRADRWRRFVSPRRCARRFLRWAGVAELPEDYAARRAVELSLFECRPPARMVGGLVDFHVVTDSQQTGESAGLDFVELQSAFVGEWSLVWRRTYSFLGPFYAGRLTGRWREEERRLSEEHPDDGGNCCLVWFRAADGRTAHDGSATAAFS